jgi:hypothetical protein
MCRGCRAGLVVVVIVAVMVRGRVERGRLRVLVARMLSGLVSDGG